MNKEQQEILDEAYNNYGKRMVDIMNVIIPAEFKDKGWVKLKLDYQGKYDVLSKEEFINKIKTDIEFSERWGLKIKERELSLEERMDLINKMHLRSYSGWQNWSVEEMEDRMNNDWNIPTRLITVTYNNKTIESYE